MPQSPPADESAPSPPETPLISTGAVGAQPDALLPPAMAAKAEQIGIRKAKMDAVTMFTLAVLAGAFIAFGAIFATTVSVGGSALPYGLVKCLAGTVFSLGLILVIVGGAELFTGNNLIVMAWAARKIPLRAVARNWGIVYAGNFVGAVGVAVLVLGSGHHTMAAGEVGRTMLTIAAAKCRLGFSEALCLGILCNILVCLAVWLTFSARTTTDRILAIVPPIAAFVAAGFEHCVANMYFVPLGLFLKAGASDEFWMSIDSSPDSYSTLTWTGFLQNNLLPVTLGNMLGGVVLVGIVYWFVYLRNE